MKKPVLLAVALMQAAFISNTAHAQDWFDGASGQSGWVFFGTTSVGATYWLRTKDYVGATDYRRSVWMKSEHSFDKTVKWREQKTLFKIDCSLQQIGTQMIVRTDARGGVIYNWSVAGYRVSMDPAIPDSMGERIVGIVCDG